MTKIILYIEVGDWDGGHNGYYPKLIEWNLEDEHYPIEESDGWGHGLGGSRSSLQNFLISSNFEKLKSVDSEWAYMTIKNSIAANLPVNEISKALSRQSKKSNIQLPESLCMILNRSGSYLNP